MDFHAMIQSMTPEIYERLKRAIELGKWENGVLLTKDQLETCMQAIIAYDHEYIQEEQRIGYIDRGSKSDGEICESTHEDTDKPIKFLDS